VPLVPPGARLLGSVTLGSSNANVGPIVFGPGYGRLWIEHFIAGYSGSGIAIIQFGTGTTVDTGANYASGGFHVTMGTAAVSATPTSRVSQAGLQVANDATANARDGVHEVSNATGRPKICDSRTITYSTTSLTAATAITTISVMVGRWFNNAQAQCVGMNASGALTLNSGTALSVYGIPGAG